MIQKLNIEEIKPSSRRYPAIIFDQDRDAGAHFRRISSTSLLDNGCHEGDEGQEGHEGGDEEGHEGEGQVTECKERQRWEASGWRGHARSFDGLLLRF
jgi:hypothetical protein